MWVTAIFAGVLTLLAVYDTFDFAYWIFAFGCVTALCLVTICVCYLAIRTRINCRVPAIDGASNRQNEPQNSAKLSRTLFIMITASLVFWIPGIVVNCTYYLCSHCIPLLVLHI